MKVFFYDINGGNKGIIFAKDEEKAIEIFKNYYPEADPYNYDNAEIDDKYEAGAVIDEICEYDGKEKLVLMTD